MTGRSGAEDAEIAAAAARDFCGEVQKVTSSCWVRLTAPLPER
jgi:hypothetical protein